MRKNKNYHSKHSEESQKSSLNIYKIICAIFIIFCIICTAIVVMTAIHKKRVTQYVIKEQDSLIKKQQLVTPLIIHFNNSEKLKNKELKNLIKKINPFGVVFYDYEKTSYDEIKKINNELSSIFPNRKLYLALDQEGGLVNRLRKFEQEKGIILLKKASYYGKIAQTDLVKAKQEIYLDSRKTAKILKDLKFNLNFAPMIDLAKNHEHGRIYSPDPQITYELALSFIKGMHDEGIMTTIKHMPGIGRNQNDTHKQKVNINATKQELTEYDLVPFKKLAKFSEFAMVTHATYTKIDNKPATISKKTIDFIRKETGFKGFLISDAFNMEALLSNNSSYSKNAISALDSGIDILVTNCSDHYCDIDIVNAIQKTDYIKKFNEKLRNFEKENELSF